MKKLLFSAILVSFLAITIILLKDKAPKYDEFITIKEAHNYVDDGDDTKINLTVYFSKENKYIYKENINTFQITNINDEETLALKLLNVKKTDCVYEVNKKKYEAYVYEGILQSLKMNYQINEAYLRIVSNGEEIKGEIGSFNIKYYEKLGDDDFITLNLLEGVTVNQPYMTLGMIHLKIENLLSKTITINKISIDDDVTLYQSDSLITENHDIFGASNSFNKEKIASYGELELYLPLCYLERKFIKETYIFVEYQIDNVKYEYFFDRYNFYDNNYLIPNDKEVINIYEYN